ncbi:winged helix-turn-helix domain-containing protein [Pseudarthrobacter humi]|uniref:winged helix-turn-helix domain-containing protein n=1 Tax=Pseudarthrobacter humi TaxID=2952523 RepID=UPI0035590B7E
MTPTGVSSCCRPVYSSSSLTIPLVVVSMSSILMNRTRSRIIRFLLRNGPSTCNQIGRELRASPSSVRRHLSLLREAGLVQRSSAGFSASAEGVQSHISVLEASFQIMVMPPSFPTPMS